jgi:hypothetical protein
MKVTSRVPRRLVEVAFRKRFSDEVLVTVDVAKAENSWKHDYNFYVGPGGTGHSVGMRYQKLRLALERDPDLVLDAPEVALGPSSTPWGPEREIRFADGRHRFAALRDLGYRTVKFAVPKSDAPEMKKRFGA